MIEEGSQGHWRLKRHTRRGERVERCWGFRQGILNLPTRDWSGSNGVQRRVVNLKEVRGVDGIALG